MVTVGGGDVGVAVEAEQADGQAAQRRHHPRRVSRPDQGFVFLIGHVPDPVKAVFYLPVAPHPGRQGGGIGVAVAGNEVDDFDGLLSVPGDGAAQLRDLGRAGDSIQAGTSATLIVRRVRRPWSVLTAENAGTAAQGSFFSRLYRVGMLPLTVIT